MNSQCILIEQEVFQRESGTLIEFRKREEWASPTQLGYTIASH
jgi:hypothetical protein